MLRLGLASLLLFVTLACSGGGSGGDDSDGGAMLPLETVSLEYGSVGLGVGERRAIIVRNPAGGRTVRITALDVSSGQLKIAAAQQIFPIFLAPGARLDVSVTWTPEAEGFFSETLRIVADERDPLFVGISGTGIVAETVIDLGSRTFSGADRVTGEIFVDVPADALALTIEAFGGTLANPTGGAIFLQSFIGPGNRTYVDEATPFAGPYIFERNWPTVQLSVFGAPYVPSDHATFMLPNTDSDGAQLVPGGGTYSFKLSNRAGTMASARVRVIIERRAGATPTGGHIDINVFIARGLAANAGNAATDPHLQTILSRAHSLLAQAGIGFGDIDYYDLLDPTFDVGDPFAPGALFRNSVIAAETRLNIFLVKRSSLGLAGLTGAIPGPRAKGSPIAGIWSLGDELIHPEDLGSVLAHEVGHYLGLGHTREAPGSSAFPWTEDIIEDTCPGTGCVGRVDQYLMDANANVQTATLLTPGQIQVIRGHVLVEPGRASFTPGAIWSSSPLLAAARLASAGCGNCGR